MNKHRKIIFLDIDGVLNTEYYQGLLEYQGKPWQDEYGAFFDPKSVKQLKKIIDATDADIVVESSWKYLGLDAMKELWDARNLPGRVIDITPSSVSNEHLININLDYLDTSTLHCKGIEIASWLAEQTEDIRYVIIDDEYVILESQFPHFILTNPYEGITEEQANRTISILNG